MEVEIVHYKVVGDYAGPMVLLRFSGQYFSGVVTADVTDRIEIEFDWNQETHTLVGTPIIRNAQTKIVKIGATNTGSCPGSTKVDAGPEFLTATSLKSGVAVIGGDFELEGRRETATGSFPTAGDGGCGIANAKSTSEPVKLERLQLAVTPTLLYLPTVSKTTRATADKKSIVTVLSGVDNWTWTITPTAR